MKHNTEFTLYNSHLDLAHTYWKKIARPGAIAIDATCGNGHDTLILANIFNEGLLYAIDLQQTALAATKARLEEHLVKDALKHIILENRCHSSFPEAIKPGSVSLIIYNLGYLPGGDKALTTMRSTTKESLQHAIQLIKHGGAISVTCYPGHPEGKEEEAVVLEFAATLDPKEWSCCHHRWINRKASPSLLILQKKIL